VVVVLGEVVGVGVKARCRLMANCSNRKYW
jgi:hypothetical protein